MAYVTTNPPSLISQTIGGSSKRWVYVSADPIAVVKAANYITNAYLLGLRTGDTIEVRDTATPTSTLCSVVSVVTNGAADLSDGTAISQANL